MNVNVICIGKLKEKYWEDAIKEYSKRLGSFCQVKIVELKEAKLPKNASPADEQNVILKEGEEILAKISDGDYVIALEVEGKLLGSEELAREIELAAFNHSTIDFVIGGSLGLSADVKRRANLGFSMGRITLPHQLARVVLLEQIYRSYKIINGETYHK